MTDHPPDVRPCAIQWIGTMPSRWSCRRLKHVASVALSSVDKKSHEQEKAVRLCNYVDVYYNERITSELEFMQATATPDEVRRFMLRSGDVLITKDSEAWDDIAVPAYVPVDLEGVLCGYHLARIRPIDGLIDGEYLARSFAARGINDQFRVAANGITRFGIGKHWIDNALFLVPPIDEQRAIAQFLTRETARIDVLIEKKLRQINLLHQKRAALIRHAVTKGLDSNAPMRDSGVDWLGLIPAHWTVCRLMSLTPAYRQIMYGIVLPGPHVEGGLPIVKAGNVAPGKLRHDLLKCTTPEIEAPFARARLRAGDLVFAIRGSIGAVEMVPEDVSGSNITQDVARVAPRSGVESTWLLYALESSSTQEQVAAATLGATVKGLNIFDLKRLYLPVPPPDEQRRLGEWMRVRFERIATVIARVETSIDRLREYRTALISAAITGKIDLRKEVA